MMQKVGFSTGAVARGNLREGLRALLARGVQAIELSTLRAEEFRAFQKGFASFKVPGNIYVSLHAPSKLEGLDERDLVQTLHAVVQRNWPVIVHPDVITDFALWRSLGRMLLIENMDTRKRTGRTADEVREILRKLPEARMCFDMGTLGR